MGPHPDKAFFKAHPLEELSAAMFQDASIEMEFNEELHQKTTDTIVNGLLDNSRKEQLSADLSLIATLDSGEAVVRYMRQKHDPFANYDLYKKALSMEEETCPLIVRRYMTTAQEHFIDSAFRILTKADVKYAEKLLENYREIRNPYAQATACLLFGEHKMENSVPLLLKEHARFSAVYPKESYNQSPLLALYLICGEKME